MPTDLILPLSIALSMTAWSLIIYLYAHPFARRFPAAEIIQPILLLHSFRYVGLMFLVPGVTTEVLDSRFSYPAAYGDLIAALLALLALAALRNKTRGAIALVWVFNIWGTADLVNAVARGLLYTADGHLGAAYWIPATMVPPLLVTHVYVFILLFKHAKSVDAGNQIIVDG